MCSSIGQNLLKFSGPLKEQKVVSECGKRAWIVLEGGILRVGAEGGSWLLNKQPEIYLLPVWGCVCVFMYRGATCITMYRGATWITRTCKQGAEVLEAKENNMVPGIYTSHMGLFQHGPPNSQEPGCSCLTWCHRNRDPRYQHHHVCFSRPVQVLVASRGSLADGRKVVAVAPHNLETSVLEKSTFYYCLLSISSIMVCKWALPTGG